MAKDQKDSQTVDAFKRGRGRPAKDNALTNAERQRLYRQRKAQQPERNVTGFQLTSAEATAIVCMLQDKAREIACRRLSGGPVKPEELHAQEWLQQLARKVNQAFPPGKGDTLNG